MGSRSAQSVQSIPVSFVIDLERTGRGHMPAVAFLTEGAMGRTPSCRVTFAEKLS
jgi:hypothetical protein